MEVKEGKPKRKRAKGIKYEAKQYPCSHCTKRYQSENALNNHLKIKHKGSAKKQHTDNNTVPSFDDSHKPEYFRHVPRRGTTHNPIVEMKKVLHSMYPDMREHPIIGAFANIVNQAMPLTCDDMFANYLLHVSKHCNEIYYRKVVRFVFYYHKMISLLEEKSIDSIPLESNNFISRYTIHTNKKTNNYRAYPGVNKASLNLKRKRKRKLIQVTEDMKNKMKMQMAHELTRNMCEWMYKHGYTDYRISFT